MTILTSSFLWTCSVTREESVYHLSISFNMLTCTSCNNLATNPLLMGEWRGRVRMGKPFLLIFRYERGEGAFLHFSEGLFSIFWRWPHRKALVLHTRSTLSRSPPRALSYITSGRYAFKACPCWPPLWPLFNGHSKAWKCGCIMGEGRWEEGCRGVGMENRKNMACCTKPH